MDPNVMTEVVLVTPGTLIAKDAAQYLRGHGTYVNESGDLIASVCGILERVNRLVTVVPLRARYIPKVGDVVVGRVTEVQQKRWKVDINSRQDAGLSLNSINLPGGELRRRKDVDALNMRLMLEEDDVFSAEVQEARDGVASLHTRSQRYGKLGNGHLLSVHPSLVKRIKQHFVTLDIGVDIILGCNGYLWLSSTPAGHTHESVAFSTEEPEAGDTVMKEEKEAIKTDQDGEAPANDADGDEEKAPILAGFATKKSNPNNPALPETYAVPYVPTAAAQRMLVARTANAISVLNTAFIAIYPTTILDVYKASLELNLPVPDMLLRQYREPLTTAARQRKGRGK